jgi:hypothetical protein
MYLNRYRRKPGEAKRFVMVVGCNLIAPKLIPIIRIESQFSANELNTVRLDRTLNMLEGERVSNLGYGLDLQVTRPNRRIPE